jgi:Zn-dependent protease
VFGNFTDPLYIIQIFVILASLVIHEFSHALAADLLGDKTARRNGRLTLNPLSHLQLLGILLILFGPIGFAKPVPFNPTALRWRRAGIIAVAAAGPISNFILAVLCLLVLRFTPLSPYSFGGEVVYIGVYINVSLFLFNLIPIPPLDGSRILRNIFPPSAERFFTPMDVYGPFILLLLVLIPGVMSSIYIPWIQAVTGSLSRLFGIAP